jgi:adenylosuccinate synthase
LNVAVVGLQWGDEGKGKVVDLLAEHFDIVARYQGGHNAGHTVYRDGQKFVVHHIPAGIFHPHVQNVMGNGMVVDVEALLEEIAALEAVGVAWRGRLWVSDRAHVITPVHRWLEAREEDFRGCHSIGTTRRGIGPAYEDKYGRRGLLMGQVADGSWRSQVEWLWDRYVRLFGPSLSSALGAEWDRFQTVLERAEAYLADAVIQTDLWLRERLRQGARVLFEGAQGTLLDVDHGTYPFVTSSHCSAGGISSGLGISPRWVHRVFGVAKAYCTRVGAGPFPTELHDEVGQYLRERGAEYGATTGRPRRCGWLDLVALKYACDLNDVDGIILTKLDILDGLPRVRLCVGYTLNGQPVEGCPVRADRLARVEPVYEDWPGWSASTYGVTRPEDLPEAARAYIRRIEEYTGRPVVLLSSGPQRQETAWFRPPDEVLQPHPRP